MMMNSLRYVTMLVSKIFILDVEVVGGLTSVIIYNTGYGANILTKSCFRIRNHPETRCMLSQASCEMPHVYLKLIPPIWLT